MTESFAELFEESEKLSKLKPGAIVIGVVVDVRNDVVVINAGLKSEGIVPIEQFRNEAGEIDVGSATRSGRPRLHENGFGETVPRARRQARHGGDSSKRPWRPARSSPAASAAVKGGFTVDVKDVRVPAQFAGRRAPGARPGLSRGQGTRVQDHSSIASATMSSSPAARWSKASIRKREQLLDACRKGAIVDGVVKNLTDYGAFVDWAASMVCCITDGVEARAPNRRSGGSGREMKVRIPPDRERNRVSPPEATGEDPWTTSPAVARPARACSARCPTSPTTAACRDRAGRRGSGARVGNGLDQQERQSLQGGAIG